MTTSAFDPKRHWYRWLVLILLSLAMFGNYYVYDSIAPLAQLLDQQRGIGDAELGTLNGVYSLPNVVMVLVGGIIIDRIGARLATTLFAGVCLLGAILTAVGDSFAVMVAGRLLFGVGAESMIVAITTSLGLWFGRRELGLALGLNLMIARAGSYAADMSPTWFSGVYAQGASAALWLAAAMMGSALACALVNLICERRVARSALAPSDGAEKLVWRDVLSFGRDYWIIVAICIAYYSAIFPFRSTFAVKYFGDAFGMTNEAASELNSYVFLAAIFATPAFGWLAGAVNRRSLLQLLGAVLLPTAFLLLLAGGTPGASNVFIGIAFSLVPAVMWPLVVDLVRADRLGSAYGLMTMLQNIGLMAFNFLGGWLNARNDASAANPAGYDPMLWAFLATSAVGALFALRLAVVRRGR